MASFFEELQVMDDAAKKRVLVIATIVIMIIVVGIWAVYFNSIVMGSSGLQDAAGGNGAAATAVTAPAPVAAGPGIWQRVEGEFASIGNVFKRPANYSIQPKQ